MSVSKRNENLRKRLSSQPVRMTPKERLRSRTEKTGQRETQRWGPGTSRNGNKKAPNHRRGILVDPGRVDYQQASPLHAWEEVEDGAAMILFRLLPPRTFESGWALQPALDSQT